MIGASNSEGGQVPGWGMVAGLVLAHLVGVIGFMAPTEMAKGLPLPLSTLVAGWVIAACWVLAAWWSGRNRRRWFLKFALIYWVGLTLLMLLVGSILSSTELPLLVAIVVGLAHGPIDGVSASLNGGRHTEWQVYVRLGLMGAVALAYWLGSRNHAR